MEHKGTVTLRSPRLVLRRLREEDVPAMYGNWASDAEVTRFLTWETHASAEVSREVIASWVESYADPSFYQWGIELAETGQLVGTIGVVGWPYDERCAEIGYCIGRPWWHQGITSEALATVIDYLFGEVGVARISAKHDVENLNSGGVMRHCGMSLVGTPRRECSNNRGLVDMNVYDIIPEDWEAARNARELMESHAVAHPMGTKTRADSATVTTHLLRHEDINGANRLFGGRLMEWIDDAAGIAAIRHCGMDVTTACVDTLEFKAPAFLDNIVVIEAEVTFVGKSSLEVRVNSFVEDPATGARTLINKAFLTEVCVDADGRPCVVPYGLALTRAHEFQDWESALFRKEVHTARRSSGV